MAGVLAGLVRADSAGVDHRRRGWYAGLVIATVLAMIGLGATGGPASAQAAWSVVPSPNVLQLTNGQLNSVSCASASFCMAVGDYEFDGGSLTGSLTEKWNGSTWSIADSGNAENANLSSVLYGVSCVSASFCAAVGAFVRGGGLNQSLVETWNGSSWTGVTFGAGDRLSGVSCVSATSCIAVGYTQISSAGSPVKQTVVESWNGTSWTGVTSPDTGDGDNVLAGVSCLSATSCIAVGSERTSNPGNLQTLAESWNGTAWSIVPSPSRPGTSLLSGVSCVSASSCTAAGSSTATAKAVKKTLIESWNGTTWSIATSPNNPTGHPSYLSSVSCPTATFCIAGGSQAQVWNGSTWSIVYSLGRYTSGAGLSGVSCLSATECLAAGWSRDSSLIDHPLSYTWNGTAWAAAPAPGHPVLQDTLSGVACVSASFCTAVGTHTSGPFRPFATQTLAESWNGSTWSVVPSPNHFQNGAENNGELSAVSCLSASSCTAVGSWTADSADNHAQQTLVESWNGSTWSLVPSPDRKQFGYSNELTGVSCVSASFCTAVGSYFPNLFNDQAKTLIESWNGTKWSIVPSPVEGMTSSLASVSCVSASSCIAAGSFVASTGGEEPGTLVESWNGSTWSATPGTLNSVSILSGVSCVSATSCIAVGNTGEEHTLVESWNGSTWSTVSSPNGGSGPGINELNSVSCASATSCTAVGEWASFSNERAVNTLVESWDGTTWSVVTSPDGPLPAGIRTGSNDLLGVSCLAASCTAAGDYSTAAPDDNQSTLIESNA
jgi:hypothetical protein